MKVIRFNKPKDNEAAGSAKELYEDCKSGEVSGFIAITLDKENNTTIYVGNSENDRKSILNFMGAVAMLTRHGYDALEELSEE